MFSCYNVPHSKNYRETEVRTGLLLECFAAGTARGSSSDVA